MQESIKIRTTGQLRKKRLSASTDEKMTLAGTGVLLKENKTIPTDRAKEKTIDAKKSVVKTEGR